MVLYLGIFVALYLCGTLAFFVTQRALGKPLSFRQVIWPPAWKEYPQVQSRFFFEKARKDITARAINEAIIDLSLAYQLDPKNYAAGFTLTQLCQIGQPGLADQIFAQLVREHPSKRTTTLVAWYQALLLRGDFTAIRTLAAEALRSDDPARESSWLHAILFAHRCEPDAEALTQLATDPKLTPQARALLGLELRTQKLTPEETRLLLLNQPPAEASPYFDYYRVHRLISLGLPEEALAVMGEPSIRLGLGDRRAFWLDAHARLGWTEASRGEVLTLLAGSPDPKTIILLCAHLIRYPDRKLNDLLFARLRQIPLPASEASYATYIALLCTAGTNEDYDALQETAATLRQLAGNRFRVLADVVAFFRMRDPNTRIEAYLPSLQPQPIEITYALLQRFHHAPPRRPEAVR